MGQVGLPAARRVQWRRLLQRGLGSAQGGLPCRASLPPGTLAHLREQLSCRAFSGTGAEGPSARNSRSSCGCGPTACRCPEAGS